MSRRRLLMGAAGAVVLAGGGALAVVLTRPGTQPGVASPVAAGPPPEPVIEERVLGVRSSSPFPFATTQVGGRPAALVSDLDNLTRLRDLVTDHDIGLPLPGYTLDVKRAGVVAVDGRDILVTAAWDEVRVIDIQAGTGTPAGRHEGVWGFTSTSAGGRALAATAGLTDGIVRRWDLSSRSLLGEQSIEAVGTGPDLSTAMIDGRLCLVVHVLGRSLIQVWDFVTGEPIARTNARGEIALLDGVTVLVDTTDRLEVIDLRTGAVVRRHDIGGGSRVSALAVLDGRPVVACEGERGSIVLRDVDTGRPLGAPLTGHEAALTALGVADLNGRPILVSGARDNTIRVWDLAVRAAG
jgi:WD40 repeat protein